MRTILRLLGTDAAAADRAVAIIASITERQLIDTALAVAALAVVVIDVTLISVILGGA